MDIQEIYKCYLDSTGICTDTRTISSSCMFFALKGDNFNGNTFAMNAIKQGASYAVIDEDINNNDNRLIKVPNALKCLQKLASYHRSKLKIPIIGITGSNGKTTTKELIRAVLEKEYKVKGTTGNLNNHIGVPLTLLSFDESTDIGIVEMGANHEKEIQFLCEISRPDFGLITNIGKAHLEGFGSPEGVVRAKKELYDFIGSQNKPIFINLDNDLLTGISDGISKLSYSSTTPSECIGTITESHPYLKIKYTSANNTYTFNTHLVGEYNLENILVAIRVGYHFNIDPIDIHDAISNYIPSNNRSQAIKTKSNTIILDAYNANPSSMYAALNDFNVVPEPKALILGDMKELGEYSHEEHLKLLRSLKSNNYTPTILVGSCFFEHEKEFSDFTFCLSTDDAKTWLTENPIKEKKVLIKGSRSIGLEKLVGLLD